MAFNTNLGKQSFTASANQTEFDFNFKIYEPTDIQVFKTPKDQDPNDQIDKLVYPGDYTVTIDGDDGGEVILTTPATLDDTVVLNRHLPLDRTTSYVTNGDLKAVTLNADQDYQTYLIIDANVSLKSTIRLPQSAVNVDPILPNVRPNSYLRWNADGDALENDEAIPQAVIDVGVMLGEVTDLRDETTQIKNDTEAVYDAFTDLYLGAKASDPATDNDGDPLQVGALYLNTTDNAMKVWNGTTWLLAYANISEDIVDKTTDQTIAGVKTFSSPIIGSISGNAGSATELATARTINGVVFNGTANITIEDSTKAPLASPALTGTPTAPTPGAGTNNTQIATTAFVMDNGANASNVASAIAAIPYGGVGSYVFGSYVGGGILYPGNTVAGSVIYPAAVYWKQGGNLGLNNSATVLTGTWRIMGGLS